MKPGVMAEALLSLFRGEQNDQATLGALFLAEALIVLREAHTAKKK